MPACTHPCLYHAVKYVSPYTGVCVIRCAKDDAERVLACMALTTALKARGVALRLVQAAGTLQACLRAAVPLNELRMHEAAPRLNRQVRHSMAACTLCGMQPHACMRSLLRPKVRMGCTT